MTMQVQPGSHLLNVHQDIQISAVGSEYIQGVEQPTDNQNNSR